MKFINDFGLRTYDVRTVQISDYLKSLFRLVDLLSITGLYPKAVKDTNKQLIAMIRSYIDELIAEGKYDEYVEQVKKFKLTTQTFDAFGETIIDYITFNSFITTDTDIDRQLRIAESKLGGHGISNEYGKLYYYDIDPMGYKINVILFAASEGCVKKLHSRISLFFFVACAALFIIILWCRCDRRIDRPTFRPSLKLSALFGRYVFKKRRCNEVFRA